jgi:hypothetical protein
LRLMSIWLSTKFQDWLLWPLPLPLEFILPLQVHALSAKIKTQGFRIDYLYDLYCWLLSFLLIFVHVICSWLSTYSWMFNRSRFFRRFCVAT